MKLDQVLEGNSFSHGAYLPRALSVSRTSNTGEYLELSTQSMAYHVGIRLAGDASFMTSEKAKACTKSKI